MSYEIVDAQYVLDNIGKIPIVDVRPRDMFFEGHIPGAINVPLMEALQSDEDSATYFVREFIAAGLDPTKPSIIYCHNGQLARQACDLLASTGDNQQRCYEGSWTDWITDSSRPIEK